MSSTPIIGRVAPGEQVRAFRERKLELKARNYPVTETKKFIKEYYQKIIDKVKESVDKNTVLGKVPSGSGMNKIVHLLAAQIAKDFGATVVPDGVIRKRHTLEAKHNLTIAKRNVDPISYRVDGEALKAEVKGKKVIILDDLIGSGESAVKLKKEMERVGVGTEGLLNLITVEKRYPSENDLKRVCDKLMNITGSREIERGTLDLQLTSVFGEYTRQKLNRFEREIRTPEQIMKAKAVLAQASAIEGKSEKLSVHPVKSISQSKNLSQRI